MQLCPIKWLFGVPWAWFIECRSSYATGISHYIRFILTKPLALYNLSVSHWNFSEFSSNTLKLPESPCNQSKFSLRPREHLLNAGEPWLKPLESPCRLLGSPEIHWNASKLFESSLRLPYSFPKLYRNHLKLIKLLEAWLNPLQLWRTSLFYWTLGNTPWNPLNLHGTP